MIKKIGALQLMVLCCATSLSYASGYRISEQSLNSTALGSAYVAHARGPDAAYFNPANLSWGSGNWEAEGGLSLIYLPSIKYEDSRDSILNGGTREEGFVIPNLFVQSPAYENFTFGFALVFPAGLSKKWDDPYPRTFAEENSMTVVEANPSVSYRFSDRFSMGFGVRFLYSEATIKNNGSIMALAAGGLGEGMPAADEFVTITRDMEGDTTEFGYNVALAVRPLQGLSLAATYRSEIDLEFEGDGVISAATSFPAELIPGGTYQGPGSVSIPIPAILALAAAYTYEKVTVEFTYDRTFWSAYDALVFHYPTGLGHPVLIQAFDTPVVKDWDDVNAYRIGITYLWSRDLTLMAGAGIDGNPVPDHTLSFDLPDSDAWFASLGFRYGYNEKLSYGAAYLYADREDRRATNATVDGTFSGGASHLLALSLRYAL